MIMQSIIDHIAGVSSFPQKILLFGCCVLLSMLTGLFFNYAVRKFLFRHCSEQAKSRAGISGALRYPLFYLFALTGIYHSLKIFSIPENMSFYIFQGYFAITILLILKGCLNAVNILASTIRSQAKATGNMYSELLLSLVEPTMKTILWLLGILFILDNVLHFKIGTLLAGAGIVSMAIAFAAQSTIANFFGAIMLIVDQPFLAGHRIIMNDKEGIVQSIGLRSVRLLAVDGTIWYIPNKLMAETPIVNLTLRPYYRLSFTLNMTYFHTPEKLQKGKELLREILLRQPLIAASRKEPRITFDNFSASSLDILVTCWMQTADVAEFHAAKDALNMEILRVFKENGFDFAFPTQTVFMGKDTEIS